MSIRKIRSKEDLIKYGIQPGEAGVWYGGVFFHQDGTLYDFNGYDPDDSMAGPRSRIKKRSRVAVLWKVIKIGALIDALIVASYSQWGLFEFLKPIAEPQVCLGKQILKFLGLA